MWLAIINHASGTNYELNLSNLVGFSKPITSQYTATSPHLLDWFKNHNEGKTYSEQVKPFNFMLCHQVGKDYQPTYGEYTPKSLANYRPISAYDKDVGKAATKSFDRKTGKAVHTKHLKSYAEALQGYNMQPESKFLNGNYSNSGFTQRRHIYASEVHYIGKESNKWEDDFYLGFDEENLIEYAPSPDIVRNRIEVIQRAITIIGKSGLAKQAKLSARQISNISNGKNKPSKATFYKLYDAAKKVIEGQAQGESKKADLLCWLSEHIQKTSLKETAEKLGTNSSNLSNTLKGRRALSKKFANKILCLKAEKDY